MLFYCFLFYATLLYIQLGLSLSMTRIKVFPISPEKTRIQNTGNIFMSTKVDSIFLKT